MRRSTGRAADPGRGRRVARAVGGVLVVAVAVALDVSPGVSATDLRGGGQVPLAALAAGTVAVYSALLVRWRHSRAAFVVVWTFSFAGVALPGFTPVAGLLLALHALATRVRGRAALAGLLATVAPFAVDAYNGAASRAHRDVTFWGSWAGQLGLYLVLAVAAWGVGRLAAGAAARAERERQATAAATLQAERLRLARELHDSVASAVSVMLLQAAGVQHLVPGEADERVRRALTTIERTGQEAMDELHRMLGLLRSVDEQAGAAAAPARTDGLEQLVDTARQSGLVVGLRSTGDHAPISSDVDLVVYRVVQESLHNARKHAGPDASVEVSLTWSAGWLTVGIRSRPGTRAAPSSAGHSSDLGLRGMRERVELVGGTFSAGPDRDGFVVDVELPVVQAVGVSRDPLLAAGAKR